MPHEFLEHTADVRLKVSGSTPEDLFAESVAGLMELMQPREDQGSAVVRHVTLTSPNLTTLLIDFLGMVLLGAQTRRERYDRVRFDELTDQTLEADLTATPIAGFGRDVKAVTYHEAEVQSAGGAQWETMIVFDI